MKKKKDQEPDDEGLSMNLEELRELIELVSEKGFAEFEVERQGFRLRIARFNEPAAHLTRSAAPASPAITPQPSAVVRPTVAQPEPAPPAASETSQAAEPEAGESARPEAQLHTIKSPIVGTFYRSPSPASEPFVKIGDHVEQDMVVCIIEAMKLMNEIQSEVTGEVVRIYVENGQPVEYGQPLFGIKT
jgi:acetyl-CoA carboxylase biotin carboxyl carrier protein